MWTHENRAKYNRDHLRYPSDLTDDEWTLVEPFIPPAKAGGGKRRTDMRAVMDGVMYILSTGCQWRYLPKDFPPRSTVHNYFVWWQCDGVLDRIHHALYVECRERAEREASPTACIIDSQSVKSAEKGGPSIDPPGYDAGKKIKGKKRHILVDTMGLLLHAIVHSAGIQDRDGGIFLLATLFGQFPFLEKMFADSAYQGPIFGSALAKILPCLETEIVKRSDQAKGFVQLPKRWIVERTIAWLNRCRRLAKDWENLNRNALAFLKLASIRLMLRKLC
ncbi:IS5 family transposase, partial [Bradyrhizobium sp.]|uniref:IS5 family transposase n=1 Tax=Bradyrhizobium sp. TaxID=376 RepID=UPI003C78D478